MNGRHLAPPGHVGEMNEAALKRRTPPLALLAALAFGAVLAVYLVTLPQDLLPGDSGELIAASWTLSIAHPPGFPLYLMAGKLFASVVRLGTIAYRYNLFSAVTGAAASGLIFLVLARLGVGRLLGLAVAVGIATRESYWLQATTAEVYALSVLFTALVLWVALGARQRDERAMPLVGFIGGLAVSHHLALVYPLICALVILALGHDRRPRARTVVYSALLLGLGLSIWLYIPIRAGLSPPLVWGDTRSLSGFVDHISAQDYRWRLRTFDAWNRVLDLARYFRALAGAGGGLMMLAAGMGVVLNLRRLRAVAGPVLLVILYAGHCAIYDIPDIASHAVPALVGVAALAGMGLQRISESRRIGRLGTVAAVALACLIVVSNLLGMRPRKDQEFALDYARAVEASAVRACGPDCIIVCSTDVGFPLLYDWCAGTGKVRIVYADITDPARAGLDAGVRALDGLVRAAVEKFGASRVALFGASMPFAGGRPTRISGFVQVVGEDSVPSPSPLSYQVRGVGEDLRDYASRRLSGDYYIRLARWCVERNEVLAAKGYIARGLAAAYDDGTTHLDAADIYRGVGLAGEARQLALAALAIDRDSYEAHAMLAGLALREGDSETAIAEYTRALRGTPSPGPMRSNLGAAYLARGDYSGAAAQFAMALALDSTLVTAHLGMGRALEAQDNLVEALGHYDRARHLDPASGLVARYREALLQRMGK